MQGNTTSDDKSKKTTDNDGTLSRPTGLPPASQIRGVQSPMGPTAEFRSLTVNAGFGVVESITRNIGNSAFSMRTPSVAETSTLVADKEAEKQETEFRSVSVNAGLRIIESGNLGKSSFAMRPPSMEEVDMLVAAKETMKQQTEAPKTERMEAFNMGRQFPVTQGPRSLESHLNMDRVSLNSPCYPMPGGPVVEGPVGSYNATTWSLPELRPVPKYYPMERSNCILSLSEHSVEEITRNISECLRLLSVHAKYFNKPAAAALLTPEHVEIYLTLWKASRNEVQVEVQRRRGDSVTFHRYCRHILDAASGDFDKSEVPAAAGSLQYLKAAEKLLRSELSKASGDEESKLAMELTHSLLKKERLDARRLGMESLCIITDPTKTHLPTTVMASRAVVLGGEDSVSNDIHAMIINLVQNRCMGDEDDLLEGMPVEYDSDDEDFFPSDDERDNNHPPEYNDSLSIMINHAFTVLSNALQVLSTFEPFDTTPETTPPLPSMEFLVDHFLLDAYEVSNTDMIFSLLKQIQRAPIKPHNACLASKSLFLLVSHSSEARERAIKLGALSIVERALDVGITSHSKLEQECRFLLEVLNSIIKH